MAGPEMGGEPHRGHGCLGCCDRPVPDARHRPSVARPLVEGRLRRAGAPWPSPPGRATYRRHHPIASPRNGPRRSDYPPTMGARALRNPCRPPLPVGGKARAVVLSDGPSRAADPRVRLRSTALRGRAVARTPQRAESIPDRWGGAPQSPDSCTPRTRPQIASVQRLAAPERSLPGRPRTADRCGPRLPRCGVARGARIPNRLARSGGPHPTAAPAAPRRSGAPRWPGVTPGPVNDHSPAWRVRPRASQPGANRSEGGAAESRAPGHPADGRPAGHAIADDRAGPTR